MTFTRYFRSCALFCALLEFSRIFALHVLLSEVAKKALKSCDFKAFSCRVLTEKMQEQSLVSQGFAGF